MLDYNTSFVGELLKGSAVEGGPLSALCTIGLPKLL